MLHKAVASIFVLSAGLMSQAVWAETPVEILSSIKSEALAADPAFQGFSALRGEKFFRQKHGNEWSCASCHTDNPAVNGKHDRTGKTIQPLAPAANTERFTNPRKVAKWFKRNCNDVLDRVCTPQEQGDVLSYLLTIKN